jgi:hypothetical protein
MVAFMARPTAIVSAFNRFVDEVVTAVSKRLPARSAQQARPVGRPQRAAGGNTRAPGGASANERRRRAMTGRKLDMSCRIEGCKNRSGGPGKGYMCPTHQKLPKKVQQAARDAWKAKHAA